MTDWMLELNLQMVRKLETQPSWMVQSWLKETILPLVSLPQGNQ